MEREKDTDAAAGPGGGGLMELNIESQKQEFLTICRTAIQREGLEDLLAWMGKADFFTAPASTHYHGAYAGGLCQHSIDVYKYAKRLLFPDGQSTCGGIGGGFLPVPRPVQGESV